MNSSKDITIYDIAKSLKVSPSTVSKALKDDPAVSKKTRKKVFEAAAVMGYRSNPYAKNLRQQQSLTIGVMMYDLSSSFMTGVLSGIEKAANEAGYGIVIMDSAQSAEKEAANARSLFHRRVDGILAFLAPDTKTLDHFRPFIEKNTPVIFLDRTTKLPESTCVLIDNTLGGHLATQHLIEQGCRRIAHLTSTLDHDIFALRYKGYVSAMKENGLPVDGSLLLTGAATEEDIMAAACKILDMQPRPDGLFATSDFAAAVCIRTFSERGLRVPQDIAVVGFDNDIIGKLINPTLTTVNYPGREMGEMAARSLVNHLNGVRRIDHISSVSIRVELVIRQSSLKKG